MFTNSPTKLSENAFKYESFQKSCERKANFQENSSEKTKPNFFQSLLLRNKKIFITDDKRILILDKENIENKSCEQNSISQGK